LDPAGAIKLNISQSRPQVAVTTGNIKPPGDLRAPALLHDLRAG
jgi:hypothetical protein